MKRTLLFYFILQIFFVLNVYAITLDVRDGALFGATGVNVNGVLYDVEFLDGTALDLYDGADENTDFPFTNPSNINDADLARMASQALLDQVFVGIFNTTPNLINGINKQEERMFTPLCG